MKENMNMKQNSKIENLTLNNQEYKTGEQLFEDFKKELEQLINKYSLENENDTPDFILVDYLCNCLINYNQITKEKNEWYGRKVVVGGGYLTAENVFERIQKHFKEEKQNE